MSLKQYGVLKGSAIAARIEPGTDTPHYQVHLRANNKNYRIAVNVQSGDHSSLLYLADEHFQHPITAGLAPLSPGFLKIPSAPGGLALDFLRNNLVTRGAMQVLPPNVTGTDNDLNDHLDLYVQRAIR